METPMKQMNENFSQLQSLYKKCWSDENFKNQLIKKPISTIEEFSGKKINFDKEKIDLVVDDQSDSNIIYLNIPRKVDFDNIELTEEELEMLSGGVAPIVVYGIFAVCAAIGWASQ